jgi:hypothetical protein
MTTERQAVNAVGQVSIVQRPQLTVEQLEPIEPGGETRITRETAVRRSSTSSAARHGRK